MNWSKEDSAKMTKALRRMRAWRVKRRWVSPGNWRWMVWKPNSFITVVTFPGSREGWIAALEYVKDHR